MNNNNTFRLPKLPLYWLFELALPKEILVDLAIYIVNHLLKNNSFTKKKLQPHLHKTIGLNLGENLPTIILKVEQINNNFALLKDRSMLVSMDKADVQIIFPNDFFSLRNLPNFLCKLKYQKNELFADVKIIGKVDFAETLSFLLKNLNIDLEADISNFIGDVPSHFLSELFRKIFWFNPMNFFNPIPKNNMPS